MGTLEQYRQHIIPAQTTGREALQILDQLPESHSRTLFVLDGKKMVGALTYGDIRRGLLKAGEISDVVTYYMNTDFKCLYAAQVKPDVLSKYRALEIWLLPVLNEDHEIIDIIDLKKTRTVIPAAALIMAGGRGERLKPLTDNVPKPMLHVGGKPIIEINIDRLIKYGIKTFYISVRYLSDKIMEHFGDGSSKNVSIKYISEDEPMGTLGACAMIRDLAYDQLLVMNSDILTNIDFEDFYTLFKSKNALMCAASIPYKVQIPYGIMQSTEEGQVTALVEKPSYVYYANGGIYLIDKSLLARVPEKTPYNATDLMAQLIGGKERLVHYPILQYWLDIGKYEDYIRAQQDYPHINFDHS